MARLLVVDDDRQLVDVLSLSLGEAGHEVRVAFDGEAAMRAIAELAPDLVVADVNMPRLDGFALCKRLRDAGTDTPIVLLTSRDDEIDEALGLELGADDYVTKPFSMRVLIARISALLRRREARAGSKDSSLEVGKLRLDPERLLVTYGGVPVTLTLTELRLVEALVRRPGVVMSRARLLELVRGDDSVVGERIVDVYVRRVRKKLEAAHANFDCIETLVGAGYRWVVR